MKKHPNPDSEANIRRIDSKPKAKKQTHGFQVHFLRGGSSVTRMFSDTVYGGKESARRAARKFKRTAMADLPARVFGVRELWGSAGSKPATKTKAKIASAKKSTARSGSGAKSKARR